MAIDRKKFFDGVRNGPFPGKLSAKQVEGMTLVLDEWDRRKKLTDLRFLAYPLATDYHETAHTMQPIAEYGKGKGRPYGKPDPKTKKTYYGRGLVQLTWNYNYEKAGKIIGVDLLNNPDLAMQPDIAVKVMFDGMLQGWFTGKKLSDYFTATKTDWVNARRIINGTDRASLIAGYAKQFHEDLVNASK